jgi:hypothetical protein
MTVVVTIRRWLTAPLNSSPFASDGFWDVVTNEVPTNVTKYFLQCNWSVYHSTWYNVFSRKLLPACHGQAYWGPPGSSKQTDNITVVIVLFLDGTIRRRQRDHQWPKLLVVSCRDPSCVCSSLLLAAVSDTQSRCSVCLRCCSTRKLTPPNRRPDAARAPSLALTGTLPQNDK